MRVPRALRALPPAMFANQLYLRAKHPQALAAASARLAYLAGMVPQSYPGISRLTWVAWNRQAGNEGLGNRSARKAISKGIGGPDFKLTMGGLPLTVGAQ